MKNIFVYTGTGAYQARDVENFLAVFDFDYERISESELNILSDGDVLIVPGGEIKAYLPAFTPEGIELIRRFVDEGGTYIGICAGAYVTGESYNGISGLNFIDKEITGTKGQQVIDVHDDSAQSYQLIHENGPVLPENTGEPLLKDANGKVQAIKLPIGKGQVYLFAAHPEGSVYYKLTPQDFSGAQYFRELLNGLIG
jgi:GMP synthase-like glutamine amidotransferase